MKLLNQRILACRRRHRILYLIFQRCSTLLWPDDERRLVSMGGLHLKEAFNTCSCLLLLYLWFSLLRWLNEGRCDRASLVCVAELGACLNRIRVHEIVDLSNCILHKIFQTDIIRLLWSSLVPRGWYLYLEVYLFLPRKFLSTSRSVQIIVSLWTFSGGTGWWRKYLLSLNGRVVVKELRDKNHFRQVFISYRSCRYCLSCLGQ